jgi:outer membrane protein assembly factor BamB
MMKKITVILSIAFLITGKVMAQFNEPTFVNNWNNGGGNPQRNGFAAVDGPTIDSVLWQANTGGLFGMPVYIEGNRLVTMRFVSQTNSPIVCYDLYTGALLWEKDITGNTAKSLPIGVRDNQVYAVRSTDDPSGDTLYALDLNTGSKIWTSEAKVCVYGNASASFASNGDLLIQRSTHFSRISYQTGALVWSCVAHGFVVGHLEMSVNNGINTGYFLEQVGGEAYLTAVDLSDGEKKYSRLINNTNPGGGVNQVPMIVGRNGIIYAHKQGDNITALEDDGTALTFLWETPLNGNPAFSHICEGADGSVYAPYNDKIVRIEPVSGQIIDSSQSISVTPYFFPVISAAQNNMIYLTNAENELYAFDLDLNLVWMDELPNNNTSGVAIGTDGLLAVAGSDILKVYTTGFPVSVEEPTNSGKSDMLSNYPNPFNTGTRISYTLPDVLFVSLKVYDILGHEIITLVSEEKAAGTHTVEWDASDLPGGVYFYELKAGSVKEVKKMMLVK